MNTTLPPTENALTERKVDRDLTDSIGVGRSGITFENAGQVMEYAKLMAASQSAVPKHLRGQPGACLGILDDAIRFQINPYALARQSYFVNDTLCYMAQVFMGVVNAHAPLKTRPDIRWEGAGQERRCVVTGTFRDGAVREYRSPRFADITPKNSPLWKSDPDQQQSYYSLRSFARRWCPEVIMGIYDVDEIRDAAMKDVSPQPGPPPDAWNPDDHASDEVKTAIKTVLEQDAGVNTPNALAGNAPGSGEVSPPIPPSDPVAATLAPFRKSEAIGKLLQLASDTDITEDERIESLDQVWKHYDALFADDPKFLGYLFATATKVARGEQKVEAARTFLEKLP